MQNALRSLSTAAPLRELVPELDWGVMPTPTPPSAGARGARRRAGAPLLPLPGLAAELRERAARVPAAPRPRPGGRRSC